MAKFTCPYCFENYASKEVKYVCPDCGAHAPPPGLFEKEPIKCKASGCGGLATQRRCQKCDREIPKVALETPNLLFSIVGVSNSGKTNFITVMLNELGKSSGLRLALGAQNKETRDHQNENRRLIYNEHKSPGVTESGARMPQIWYIKNNMKKHRGFGGVNVPTYTFTIYDGAGEDHKNNLDPSSDMVRYIKASEAFLITLDPLTLENIREGGFVSSDVMRNSLAGHGGEIENASDIVNSLADYIKQIHGIHTNKPLNVPVAVVLTKFDTLLSHPSFAANARVKNSSLNIENERIRETEFEEIHGEIKNWLEQIGEISFIVALETHFGEKNFKLFAVSSYGESPDNDKTITKKINPHRVLDPILWLFKKAKFID